MANEIPYEKLGSLAQLFLPLIQKWGTKFLLALLSNGVIAYMVYADKIEGLYGLIAMVVVALGYFWVRRNQETEEGTK